MAEEPFLSTVNWREGLTRRSRLHTYDTLHRATSDLTMTQGQDRDTMASHLDDCGEMRSGSVILRRVVLSGAPWCRGSA